MGSELIKRGLNLPPHIWSAHANIHYPQLVKQIHKDYIKSGSEIIITNTFRTTPRAYKKTGLSLKQANSIAYKSQKAAINLAKKAGNSKTIILGSIAPLEDCYMPELFPGKKIAQSEFKVIIEWFLEKNIDGIILETMNNITETEVLLNLLNKYNIPIYVSFYLITSKYLPSKEHISDAIELIKNYNVQAVLFNCTPINIMKEIVDNMVDNLNFPWGIYPNLGLGSPKLDGKISELASNKNFLDLIEKSINKGAKFIGGCCGSSPKHINLLKKLFYV